MGLFESKEETIDNSISKQLILTLGYIRLNVYNKYYPIDVSKEITKFYIYDVFIHKHDFDENGIIYYYGKIALKKYLSNKEKYNEMLNKKVNVINENNNNNNSNSLREYYFEHNNEINKSNKIINIDKLILLYDNKWLNPNDIKEITVESDYMIEGKESDLIGRRKANCRTKQWFRVHFPNPILVTKYTLRHSYSAGWLRNWLFEGYDYNTQTWDILKHHKACDALDKPYKSATFKIDTNKKYTTFQVRHYSNFIGDFLYCSGFELYGILTDS